MLIVLFLCSLGLLVEPVWGQEPSKQDALKDSAAAPSDEAQKLIAEARNFAVNGKIDEALKAFDKAGQLRKGQCVECFQGIGMVYFQISQYKEAAASLKQALALNPENAAALMNLLGVALYLQDDKNTLDEAIGAFKGAIEFSKDNMPKAHYNLGFALIKSGKQTEGVAELKRYVALEPNTPNADSAREVINNPKLAGVQIATDFKVKATDGKDLSLKNLRGKVVLLDFWASWCGPCRREMPAVKSVWKKYGGDKFVIVGINLDENKQAFDSYMKTEGITWPQYFDGLGWDNKVSRLYGVRSIPHTVLIDADGAIRAVGLRGTVLYNKIADMLKQMQDQKTAEAK